MTPIRIRYQGDLRTEVTHVQSGTTILTDAPLDQQGKGEVCSPSDLIATAVLSCMVTMMGVTARNHEFHPGNITGEVRKTMADNPQKISALELDITLQGHYLNASAKKLLEAAALSCPAARSIHPDIQLVVKFAYE